MFTFNEAKQEELQSLQSDYRAINASLVRARNSGFREDVRALTRSRKRLSEKMDKIRNELNSRQYE